MEGDLATRADVYLLMDQADEDGNAERIDAFITAASDLVRQVTRRPFGITEGTPEIPVAKSFRVTGRSNIVDFGRDEIWAADPITVSVAGSEIAIEDYQLNPMPPRDGGCSWMRLASVAATPDAFGATVVTIAGTWGLPFIPAALNHAVTVTVQSWMESHVLDWTTSWSVNEERLLRPQELPNAAMAMVKRYGRIRLGVR